MRSLTNLFPYVELRTALADVPNWVILRPLRPAYGAVCCPITMQQNGQLDLAMSISERVAATGQEQWRFAHQSDAPRLRPDAGAPQATAGRLFTAAYLTLTRWPACHSANRARISDIVLAPSSS